MGLLRAVVVAAVLAAHAGGALERPQRRRQDALAIRGGATASDGADVLEPKKRKSQLLDGAAPEATGLVRIYDKLKRIFDDLYERYFAAAPAPAGDGAAAPAAKKAKAAAAPARSSVAGRQAARIARELSDFLNSPPEGCRVSVGKKLSVWVVTLTGAAGTVFEGEKYKLRVSFPTDYPTTPPSVYFLAPTPRHPHVYTNGDICLNLLGKDWRPNLTISQLSLSILSMLSSAKQKGIPIDNAAHADATPGLFQEGWMYHDDSC
ncbi:ubiquitin-conjugating enzyme/RWD-like protein [Pelagophyceae sp. CCMP2097]|nr:ubiquitin-conjugating enzyme/RWD-like protein [Pelagophyceae sp. CCMP2097]